MPEDKPVTPRTLVADSLGELRKAEREMGPGVEGLDMNQVMFHLKMAEIKALQSLAMRISRM